MSVLRARKNSDEIYVGGKLVQVPYGYVQAESDYTADELDDFYSGSEGSQNKQHRAAVLAKRVEFYELWLAGKIELPTKSSDENNQGLLKFLLNFF